MLSADPEGRVTELSSGPAGSITTAILGRSCLIDNAYPMAVADKEDGDSTSE